MNKILLITSLVGCANCLPIDSPSPHIQEFIKRLHKNLPFSDLVSKMTKRDEPWGVYLLFGDEREESGFPPEQF